MLTLDFVGIEKPDCKIKPLLLQGIIYLNFCHSLNFLDICYNKISEIKTTT